MTWYLSNKQLIHCAFSEYACSDYLYLWTICEIHSILQYVAVMWFHLFLLLTCWRCPLNYTSADPITHIKVNRNISVVLNHYFTFLVLTSSLFGSICTILLHQYLLIRIWLNNDTVASVTWPQSSRLMLCSWPHPAPNAMTPASVTSLQPKRLMLCSRPHPAPNATTPASVTLWHP